MRQVCPCRQEKSKLPAHESDSRKVGSKQASCWTATASRRSPRMSRRFGKDTKCPLTSCALLCKVAVSLARGGGYGRIPKRRGSSNAVGCTH